MTKFVCTLIFFLSTSYAWAGGNVLRDLQHEIDEINILLNTKHFTEKERCFLIGKSCGLFVSMEIIVRNNKKKKTPSNGKEMRGKYFDFFPKDSRPVKISQQ